METIFITGANSLLGTNIISELASENFNVIGLVRDRKKFLLPENEKLQIIQGDINDGYLLDSTLKNCHYVIHVAACTSQDIPNYSEYHNINVLATQKLILKSIDNKVKRFIYVSTANCFGYGSKESPGNEEKPPAKPFTDSYYAKSKINAQNVVLNYSDKIDVVTVNPTFMLGAYDSKPSSGQIIFMGYNKKVIFYPPGGKNFIHVKDAANGVINALKLGKNKESYLLSGENYNYKEFFNKLSNQTGNKPLMIKVPKLILLCAGLLGNGLRQFKIKNSFVLTNMQILCIDNFYSCDKAKKQINLQTTPIENAIDDAIDWFKKNKML